jgi:KDO2-lipid IV(A) lauroyltransferase
MPKRKNKPAKGRGVGGWLTYMALRVLVSILHMFPVDWSYVTCRIIGDLLYRLDRRHRHRACEHLRRSFPDWPEPEIRRVARLSMRNMVYLGLEVLFTPRLITPNRWRRHITLERMDEPLRLMVERKSAVLLLTGHFGNWEILGYMLAMLGLPTVSIARRLDNPRLDKFVLGVRERTGQRILDKKGATEQMEQLIADREAIGFIADQDAGRKGLFVDFFGRKASAYKTIALLAIRYELPIICGYARRIGEGYHFQVGCQRLICPADWADKDDPVRWITQQYTTSLEEMIRQAPEQYLWVHRRWKHRPRGEAQSEDGIA